MRQPWIGPLLLTALLLAGCDASQETRQNTGFAGLGEAAGDFAQASPGTPLRFPIDHGPHPDYRIEWWYLTANLENADGEPLGLQWTLFRQALVPPDERPEPAPWAADQLWMAHFAVSQGESHRVAERFARSHSAGNDGQAGVRAAPFRAWLDDWQLASRVEDAASDTFAELSLSAHQDDDRGRFGADITLDAEGPLVPHGEDGFSQKAADGQGSLSSGSMYSGSMYYSQPFWRVDGEVTLDGETQPVTGRAWLDREWSSQLLDERQQGWDWFSLHLASGHKLMAFQLRGGGAAGGDYRSGTWITPDGSPTPLSPGAIQLEPLATATVSGREVPTRWRLEVPSEGLQLVVEAPHAERWMATSVPYWEGAVVARDPASGERLGEGYLEMTGY
ncbi:lipocalin-like domain-containing protein [Halomonas sp. NO4]|uniref:lipocalin-like domain-containing protein n=1 Tax=Halomonas sp. NO4 TaxID=2484813 RepID=UPI0013D3933F|nr:lipocalin-like domain-containing protein [Halomonas sp. NO4]